MPGREPQPPPPTSAELTAGTGVTPRAFSPADVHSMIDTHGGGGGGGMADLVDDTTPQLGGNLDVNGFTVDGRDPSADGTKLDAIESGATADQTGAQIKVAYEAEADTNAFTDAEQTKLSGIEASATADQTGAQIKVAYEAEANAFTDAQFTKLSGIETAATADQTGAQIKAAYEAEANTNAFTDAEQTKLSGIATGAEVNTVGSVNAKTGTVVLDPDDLDDTSTTNKFTTAAEISKLSGIETGATADQTGAQIKSAYEGEADTNAFTDADHTKLDGISAGAEVNAVDTVNGATGDVVVPLQLTFVNYPPATPYNNMPAARSLAFQSGMMHLVDTSRFTEARLFVLRGGNVSQASAIMSLEYAASASLSLGNWTAAGTSAIECDITAANTGTDSGWVDLAAGAIGSSVYLGLTTTNGNGTQDPKFVVVTVQLR